MKRITLNTSRANCPKGMILEVTSVNGSGGVTGIKPIQWSDGTQASFEAKPYTLGAFPQLVEPLLTLLKLCRLRQVLVSHVT